ncbi:MAG: helix-turn-helix transcriptional regulator [Saprospiraceae bacterium]|nr:helix-turn-helix transcriptional regulator [Saprospiraceae bacterium]
MNISVRIKKRRLELNYSQSYVATATGISQSYYNKIENGQCRRLSFGLLARIATALEIEVAVLASPPPRFPQLRMKEPPTG